MAKKQHKSKSVGFRAPKYKKTVRQYDLAPIDDDPLDKKTKQILKQKMQQQEGLPRKKVKRQADTRGLGEGLKVSTAAPNVKFKTEHRKGESMQSFEYRLKQEHIRLEREDRTFADVRQSARRLEYKRDRRHEKSEQKIFKKREDRLDADFVGYKEHIAFGEVVQRPPSFADLKLPGDVSLEPKRISNLEKLSKALESSSADLKSQIKTTTEGKNTLNKLQSQYDNSDDYSDDSDDDDSTQKLIRKQIELQKQRSQQEERTRQLAEARQSQQKLEVEKARYQAQLAYQQLKSKRGNANTGGKASLSSISTNNAAIQREDKTAMRQLSDVDGGVYHHGR